MNTREQQEASLAKRLQAWKDQIEQIKSETHKVPNQYLLEFERQLDLLYAKHNLAQDKLKTLTSADDFEWDELKASLDGVCNEIENALDSANAKIG